MGKMNVSLWTTGLLASSLWAQAGFITIDQFGYRPDAAKTAVLRDPQKGQDSTASYTPGNVLQVIDSATGDVVYRGSASAFKSGTTDVASGDKIWWFDFSSVTQPGRYYVLDSINSIKSYSFNIASDVYNEVLKHAVRMFYYQRVGMAKEATYAGAAWADAASFSGTSQDTQAHSWYAKTNAATVRNVSGGWFDAGDFNKYTPWTSNYVESMLLAYLEKPKAFTDDYGLPESGNGVADIIDEAKWGMDHLLRLRNSDGSMLSTVGLVGKSPPSASTGYTYYGPANALSGWSATKAFALGAQVFARLGDKAYSDTLTQSAIKAWDWAEAHPDSLFHNNTSTNGSVGLCAGDQENETDYDRFAIRAAAGLYLYEITGQQKYLDVLEQGYSVLPLIAWSNYMGQYWNDQTLLLIRYVNASYGNASVKAQIKSALIAGLSKSGDYAGALGSDGYRSFIKDYNWGSNKYKSDYGLTFSEFAQNNLEPTKSSNYEIAAEDYLHYIHGVNPFDWVYLTNMTGFGASKSITSIYHTWFTDGSAKWDAVGSSTYGPAPGYLAGGPNSSYKWDACCATQTCGGTSNNAKCYSETLPVGMPNAKMYKDFNTSWPLNSWEITEPSNGYQMSYIRLLSHFVEERGAALPVEQKVQSAHAMQLNMQLQGRTLSIMADGTLNQVSIQDLQGRTVRQFSLHASHAQLNLADLPVGVYSVQAVSKQGILQNRIVLN